MWSKVYVFLGLGLAVAAVLLLMPRFFSEQVMVPDATEPTETLVVEDREIFITDGVKHSVPLDEIVQGCPGKDCIQSIDSPVYESISDASEWLGEEDIGLALQRGGIERFYPYRILVAHEIVNDRINGERVLVTYCPLCFTGIVFDPTVAGEQVEFGVSGMLRNSNLLMYDRASDSLWSQVSGEAVLGERTGSMLTMIPSDITMFGLWSKAHPNGDVLSRNTGRPFASYRSIPYGGDLRDIKPFFPLSNKDDRLPETTFVLGIVINGEARAYQFDAVKKRGVLVETFAGRSLVIEYLASEDAVRIFDTTDGTRSRLSPVPVFWFSWAATHPDTSLWNG